MPPTGVQDPIMGSHNTASARPMVDGSGADEASRTLVVHGTGPSAWSWPGLVVARFVVAWVGVAWFDGLVRPIRGRSRPDEIGVARRPWCGSDRSGSR